MISLVIAAALSLPLAALASDAPPPAVVAACQAEAAQLGKDAFLAKYGPTEPFGHCFAAHLPTATTTTTTTTTPAPSPDDAAKGVALTLCSTASKSHEKEALGRCVQAVLAKARQIVASCKTSSGSNKDAFRTCLAAAVANRRR